MDSWHLLAPYYSHWLRPSSAASPFAKIPTISEESASPGLCLRCPNYPLSTCSLHLFLLSQSPIKATVYQAPLTTAEVGGYNIVGEMDNKNLSSKMFMLPLEMRPVHLFWWYVGLDSSRGKQEWMVQFKSCRECSEPPVTEQTGWHQCSSKSGTLRSR